MNCTATTHLWIWTGAGTGCLNETPPQLRCQCRRYTYEEYHSQAEQNSRLRKRVAELEGAGNRMAEALRDAEWSVESGTDRRIEMENSREAWAALAGQEPAGEAS